jgi:hypothetical protein
MERYHNYILAYVFGLPILSAVLAVLVTPHDKSLIDYWHSFLTLGTLFAIPAAIAMAAVMAMEGDLPLPSGGKKTTKALAESGT